MFSVVVWPVVLLRNRFFKAKLDRTRHAGGLFLIEYWQRPMVTCSDSNCSYFSLIEKHLIIWVLGWFLPLRLVYLWLIEWLLQPNLNVHFTVSLACVAGDVFEVFLCSCKSLFTWRWGTPGRWDNPLRWGNPPVHIIYHFNLTTFTWGGGGVVVLIWKLIWTGGLPHLTGLPHLSEVPHLYVNRP